MSIVFSGSFRTIFLELKTLLLSIFHHELKTLLLCAGKGLRTVHSSLGVFLRRVSLIGLA
jgi:hypothetical protein